MEEQKRNLYQLLLQRNSLNLAAIKKFYKKGNKYMKKVDQIMPTKPILFPILNVGLQKVKQQNNKSQIKVFQQISNTYSQRYGVDGEIQKDSQISQKGVQIKKQYNFRQHFRKQANLEKILINQKFFRNPITKKNDQQEQRKILLKKQYKKYRSHKALLNFKQITFTKGKNLTNSDSYCKKRRFQPENIKVLAYGSRKYKYKFKNNQISLPPMKFNQHFEFKTINQYIRNENYEDRCLMKVMAFPLSKIQ